MEVCTDANSNDRPPPSRDRDRWFRGNRRGERPASRTRRRVGGGGALPAGGAWKAPAEEVVTATTAAGGMAASFQAYVAEESDVAALFDAAELSYGGIDVVV